MNKNKQASKPVYLRDSNITSIYMRLLTIIFL